MNQRDRHALIEQLAPSAPPCFSSRLAWLQWLVSADAAFTLNQGTACGSPLILEAGQPVRFNRSIWFCEDCSIGYRSDMLKAGRCEPGAIRFAKDSA